MMYPHRGLLLIFSLISAFLCHLQEATADAAISVRSPRAHHQLPAKLQGRSPHFSNEEWKKIVNKGCNLLQAMLSTDAQAASFFPGGAQTARSPWRNHGTE